MSELPPLKTGLKWFQLAHAIVNWLLVLWMMVVLVTLGLQHPLALPIMVLWIIPAIMGIGQWKIFRLYDRARQDDLLDAELDDWRGVPLEDAKTHRTKFIWYGILVALQVVMYGYNQYERFVILVTYHHRDFVPESMDSDFTSALVLGMLPGVLGMVIALFTVVHAFRFARWLKRYVALGASDAS